MAETETKAKYLFSNRKVKPDKVKIIGHRGASTNAPENTLASIEKAAELGYYGSECDVQPTSDGKFVIMHDATVDRTTDGTGTVSSMTLEQVKALNIDAGNNIQYYSGLKVPTLEEQLNHCKKYGLVCVCHTTMTGRGSDFLDVIRKCGMEDYTIIISTLNFCLELREKSDRLMLFYITFEELKKTNIDIAKQNDLGLSYQTSLTTITDAYKDNILYAHKQGVILNAWTEDDYSRFNILKECGVQYITTNSIVDRTFELEDVGQKQYKREKLTMTKADYLLVKSTSLTQEFTEIPNSNGYFFNEQTNTFHVKSESGSQGFAYLNWLGKFKRGDIIEIFADITVKSGEVSVGYDMDDVNNQRLAGRDSSVYPVGEHKIYRKFILPFDANNLRPFIGVGTNQTGEYAIKDGITIKINSNRNNKTSKTMLRATLKSDSGTLPERFTRTGGDLCTLSIPDGNLYRLLVTFSESLPQIAIPFVSGDNGGNDYILKTAYTSANSVQIGFIGRTTGTLTKLTDLPTNMYINVMLV